MKRRRDTLLPLEVAILAVGIDLRRDDAGDFYGFSIAKELRKRDGSRGLTAHGTLYKALDRMERAGLLTSSWEEPDAAAEEGRPRRRLYEVTGEGERALAKAQAASRKPRRSPAEGFASA